MGSTQKGTIYQMVKTNKPAAKVAVSAQRGSEVTTNTSPQQGHGYILASSHRSAAVSLNPSHRRSEAAHPTTPHSASDYPRSVSLQSGPGHYAVPTPRGTETGPRTESSRRSSPHLKSQQTQTLASHASSRQRNVSLPREEAARRGGESKSGREVGHHGSSIPDAKSTRRLSFQDQKDNLQSQILEDDPPSKVQNPQGVRVPRRILSYPKDEAVQTEPIQRITTTNETRSPRSPSLPEHRSSCVSADYQTAQRRVPVEESETGPYGSIPSKPKALCRNMNLDSSPKLSVLKDSDGVHRVSAWVDPESLHEYSVYPETKPSAKILVSSQVESNVRAPIRGNSEVGRRVTISPGVQSVEPTHHVTARSVSEGSHKSSMFVTPEPIYKQQTQKPPETTYMSQGPTPRYPELSQNPSIHAELELTPRPLPPRSLPRYGPDSSWWPLLNPEVETPQSQPTTPDFEPKCSPSLDLLLSSLKIDSSPFCEDLKFQREKASLSPPSPPKEFPSWALLSEVPPKHTCKQPIQRFSAFFLDVSEEMYNRVIWWLKDEEIKRFLEDTTDDGELSKFVKDFSGNESCHPPEAKTWASRPQVPEPRPQAPDLYDDDLEFRPPSWPQSSDNQQYFCAPAPLSPSARPRSPWGKLDPYDSSEDDKEYVGFVAPTLTVSLLVCPCPSWKPVAEYIDQQFEQYFRDESGLNRKNIQDNRVHCCLYFISPFGHGLRPLDVEFMKALHQRVNIVPILAKADTLTPPEVDRKKRKIREEIEHFGIKIYQFPDCDSDEDEDFKLQDQALKESIPFAVIGSNTVVEARGRRVRGRLYPWGIVEVENPGHCDFVKLRTMLVRTHMQDLKDVTRETHYENYRAQCIQSMTRLVVKERNRNKLTRESGTDFPIPAVPPGTDPETEKLIREKDEELRRMQEMLHKIQKQMKETY
ncbi:septin-4 [Hylobates moloch]|uniref:septin-4 n=1 Tax=Hylobates moloch TaxID=81572 RepID=UPI002675A3D8|nr:septin-4 [Hylobates moloch]